MLIRSEEHNECLEFIHPTLLSSQILTPSLFPIHYICSRIRDQSLGHHRNGCEK